MVEEVEDVEMALRDQADETAWQTHVSRDTLKNRYSS